MSYWDEKHSEEKEDTFGKDCMDIGRKITEKGAMTIMVCIDGSNQADASFRSALNMRRKFDHLEVFHAYKDIPDMQPATWRYNQLSSKYEMELIGHVPQSCYSMTWVDRHGIDVNTMLHRCVDPIHFAKDAADPSPLHAQPDLIIMGQHGRKGPKERKASIGSTADQALRLLHYPCLIVKNIVPAGPRSFIMAVDESPRSKRGLDIFMRFLNPRDTVTLVHFTTSLKVSQAFAEMKNIIKDYYENELREAGPVNSKFEFAEYESGANLAQVIVDYANDSTADVFAIAPRATKDRSSITETIVTNVLMSVLLCKN